MVCNWKKKTFHARKVCTACCHPYDRQFIVACIAETFFVCLSQFMLQVSFNIVVFFPQKRQSYIFLKLSYIHFDSCYILIFVKCITIAILFNYQILYTKETIHSFQQVSQHTGQGILINFQTSWIPINGISSSYSDVIPNYGLFSDQHQQFSTISTLVINIKLNYITQKMMSI